MRSAELPHPAGRRVKGKIHLMLAVKTQQLLVSTAEVYYTSQELSGAKRPIFDIAHRRAGPAVVWNLTGEMLPEQPTLRRWRNCRKA